MSELRTNPMGLLARLSGAEAKVANEQRVVPERWQAYEAEWKSGYDSPDSVITKVEPYKVHT